MQLPFLWKRIDSNCVNLDQTHAVIRLIRTFLEKSSPDSLIVTETNLPFHENFPILEILMKLILFIILHLHL